MWRSSISAVIAVSVLAACSSKKEAPPVADTGAPAPVPPPTATPVAPGHVALKLICRDDGGVEFSLSPWAVKLPEGDSVFTWDSDAASNVDAEIRAVNPNFPFGGKTVHSPHGGKAYGKRVPNTPKGTYKYTVTAVCSDGRKVIIDPDMIIPN